METYSDEHFSPNDAQAQLSEAERLSTVAWTDVRKTPLWTVPVLGTLYGAVLVSLEFMWDDPWWLATSVVLIATIVLVIRWTKVKDRPTARWRTMPREFRRSLIGYAVGVMIIVVVAPVLIEISTLFGFVSLAVISTAGFAIFRAHWYRAITATRSRLSTP